MHWWGTRKKLVRASWEPHAEEREQELQAGVGQGASVPVTMTQDGPGKKLRVSIAPLARVKVLKSNTLAFPPNYMASGPQGDIQRTLRNGRGRGL